MKKISIRIISLALMICMVLSMVPVSASAAKLKAPTHTYAATHGNQITVSWRSVPGVSSYQVNLSGARSPIVTNKTSYTFTGLKFDSTYDYNVMSVDPSNSKNNSDWNDEWSDKKKGIGKLIKTGSAVPQKVNAYIVGNSMTITWSPVTGATGYRVYTEAGYSAVLPASQNSYTYTKLTYTKAYQYNVQSTYISNGSTYYSGWSGCPGRKLIASSNPPPVAPKITFTKSGNKLIFSNEPEAIKEDDINKPSFMSALTPGTYNVSLEHTNSSKKDINFGIYIWNDDNSAANIKLLHSGAGVGHLHAINPNPVLEANSINADARAVAAKNYENPQSVKDSGFTIPAKEGRWIFFGDTNFIHDTNGKWSGEGHGRARKIKAGQYFEGLLQFSTNKKIKIKMGPFDAMYNPNTYLQPATYQGITMTEARKTGYSGIANHSTLTANLGWTLNSATKGNLNVVSNGVTTNKWATHFYDQSRVEEFGDRIGSKVVKGEVVPVMAPVHLTMSDITDITFGADQFKMSPTSLIDILESSRNGLAWNWANWYIDTKYNLTFTNTASVSKTVTYKIKLAQTGMVQCKYSAPGMVSGTAYKKFYRDAKLGIESKEVTVFTYTIPANTSRTVNLNLKLLGDSGGFLHNWITVS
jgi:hypothetical protein